MKHRIISYPFNGIEIVTSENGTTTTIVEKISNIDETTDILGLIISHHASFGIDVGDFRYINGIREAIKGLKNERDTNTD